MKSATKNAAVVVFAAFIAGSAGVAWNEARATRGAEERRAALVGPAAEMEASLQKLAERRRAAERAAQASRAALAELKSAAPLPSAKTPTVAPTIPNTFATKEEAATAMANAMATAFKDLAEKEKDPKWQSVQLAYWRAQLKANYAALYRSLGLTAEQIARFEAVAMRREEDRFDLGMLLRAGKISLQDSATGKLFGQMDVDYDNGVRAVLAPADFQRWKDYERTRYTRGFAAALAAQATMAGVPFSPDQAERLVQALADASAQYRRGQWAISTDIDWGIVDERAGAFLDPAQRAWLQTGSVGRLTNEFDQLAQKAYNADQAGKR